MSSVDGPEQRGPESELTPQGPRQLISTGHKVSRDQGMESRAPTTDRLLMSEVSLSGSQWPDTARPKQIRT